MDPIVFTMPGNERQAAAITADDMVCTARTMLASARLLREHGYPVPVCVSVHALFAEAAYGDPQAARPTLSRAAPLRTHPTAFPWQSAWQPASGWHCRHRRVQEIRHERAHSAGNRLAGGAA